MRHLFLHVLVSAIIALAIGAPPRHRYRDNGARCLQDTSGKYLALLVYGGILGPTEVIVFEYGGIGQPLELRHRMNLLNVDMPLVAVISHDGRYLVTIDEWTAAGTGPNTLVIYDLVNQVHTAYSGKDFLSDEQVNLLQQHAFIPGYKWCGMDYEFDKDVTKFVPTRPEECEKEGVPFVAVNLATRTVEVASTENLDAAALVPRVELDWGWSQGGGYLDGIPSKIWQWGNGDCEHTFFLDPKGQRQFKARPGK